MSYLVERKFPFLYEPIITESARVSSDSDISGSNSNNLNSNIYDTSSNFLFFALLECLNDNIQNLGNQEFKNELERLEHKINLTIFLLNNLVNGNQQKPPLQLLRLTTDGIAWQDSGTFEKGQTLAIQLYPDETISIPLKCQVIVTRQSKNWYEGKLAGLSEEEQTAWSKWVFRLHRHQVSYARHHAN